MKKYEKIIYQLGYSKLLELRDEAGESQIDIFLPGLNDKDDYMIIVQKDRALLCIENEKGEVKIIKTLEI